MHKLSTHPVKEKKKHKKNNNSSDFTNSYSASNTILKSISQPAVGIHQPKVHRISKSQNKFNQTTSLRQAISSQDTNEEQEFIESFRERTMNMLNTTSNETFMLEENFPKIIHDIEKSVVTLKRFYQDICQKNRLQRIIMKENKQNNTQGSLHSQNANLMSSLQREDLKLIPKVDVDVLQREYFNMYNEDTKDIQTLYDFYIREYVNKSIKSTAATISNYLNSSYGSLASKQFQSTFPNEQNSGSMVVPNGHNTNNNNNKNLFEQMMSGNEFPHTPSNTNRYGSARNSIDENGQEDISCSRQLFTNNGNNTINNTTNLTTNFGGLSTSDLESTALIKSRLAGGQDSGTKSQNISQTEKELIDNIKTPLKGSSQQEHHHQHNLKKSPQSIHDKSTANSTLNFHTLPINFTKSPNDSRCDSVNQKSPEFSKLSDQQQQSLQYPKMNASPGEKRMSQFIQQLTANMHQNGSITAIPSKQSSIGGGTQIIMSQTANNLENYCSEPLGLNGDKLNSPIKYQTTMTQESGELSPIYDSKKSPLAGQFRKNQNYLDFGQTTEIATKKLLRSKEFINEFKLASENTNSLKFTTSAALLPRAKPKLYGSSSNIKFDVQKSLEKSPVYNRKGLPSEEERKKNEEIFQKIYEKNMAINKLKQNLTQNVNELIKSKSKLDSQKLLNFDNLVNSIKNENGNTDNGIDKNSKNNGSDNNDQVVADDPRWLDSNLVFASGNLDQAILVKNDEEDCISSAKSRNCDLGSILGSIEDDQQQQQQYQQQQQQQQNVQQEEQQQKQKQLGNDKPTSKQSKESNVGSSNSNAMKNGVTNSSNNNTNDKKQDSQNSKIDNNVSNNNNDKEKVQKKEQPNVQLSEKDIVALFGSNIELSNQDMKVLEELKKMASELTQQDALNLLEKNNDNSEAYHSLKKKLEMNQKFKKTKFYVKEIPSRKPKVIDVDKANEEEEKKHKAELDTYFKNQQIVSEFENMLDDSNQLIDNPPTEQNPNHEKEFLPFDDNVDFLKETGKEAPAPFFDDKIINDNNKQGNSNNDFFIDLNSPINNGEKNDNNNNNTDANNATSSEANKIIGSKTSTTQNNSQNNGSFDLDFAGQDADAFKIVEELDCPFELDTECIEKIISPSNQDAIDNIPFDHQNFFSPNSAAKSSQKLNISIPKTQKQQAPIISSSSTTHTTNQNTATTTPGLNIKDELKSHLENDSIFENTIAAKEKNDSSNQKKKQKSSFFGQSNKSTNQASNSNNINLKSSKINQINPKQEVGGSLGITQSMPKINPLKLPLNVKCEKQQITDPEIEAKVAKLKGIDLKLKKVLLILEKEFQNAEKEGIETSSIREKIKKYKLKKQQVENKIYKTIYGPKTDTITTSSFSRSNVHIQQQF